MREANAESLGDVYIYIYTHTHYIYKTSELEDSLERAVI